MLEAMWAVTFASNVTTTPGVANMGGGIVVLETGRVLGGDISYTYVGDYKVTPSGQQVTAKLRVRKYRVVPGLESIFGPLESFELELSGQPSRDLMKMSGNMTGNPNLRIEVTFHRLEELP